MTPPRPIPARPTPLDATASTVLPPREAWRRLGISERSGRLLVKSGQLASVRLGARRVGILEADLVAFVQARRSVAAPPAPLPSIAPPTDDTKLQAILADVLASDHRRRRGA